MNTSVTCVEGKIKPPKIETKTFGDMAIGTWFLHDGVLRQKVDGECAKSYCPERQNQTAQKLTYLSDRQLEIVPSVQITYERQVR